MAQNSNDPNSVKKYGRDGKFSFPNKIRTPLKIVNKQLKNENWPQIKKKLFFEKQNFSLDPTSIFDQMI